MCRRNVIILHVACFTTFVIIFLRARKPLFCAFKSPAVKEHNFARRRSRSLSLLVVVLLLLVVETGARRELSESKWSSPFCYLGKRVRPMTTVEKLKSRQLRSTVHDSVVCIFVFFK